MCVVRYVPVLTGCGPGPQVLPGRVQNLTVEKLVTGVWAVDTCWGSEPWELWVPAQEGMHFPQGGPKATEGGWGIGGCHQGPGTVLTLLGHRMRKGSL